MTSPEYECPYSKIGIVGLGLIGGSLAYLIKKVFAKIPLVGVDSNKETIKLAKEKGVIDAGFESIEKMPQDIQLVFLATPLNVIEECAKKVSRNFKHEVTITDVGSAKHFLSEVHKDLASRHLFIPGHPMAGSEKTGFFHASHWILENATYILVPQNHPRYAVFRRFLKELGFIVKELESDVHDHVVAFSSHVPYLMACLTVQATESLSKETFPILKEMISSGFKDTTRVAASSPEWGAQICLTNAKNLLGAIQNIKAHLRILENGIKQGNIGALRNYFCEVKERRGDFFSAK